MHRAHSKINVTDPSTSHSPILPNRQSTSAYTLQYTQLAPESSFAASAIADGPGYIDEYQASGLDEGSHAGVGW